MHTPGHIRIYSLCRIGDLFWHLHLSGLHLHVGWAGHGATERPVYLFNVEREMVLQHGSSVSGDNERLRTILHVGRIHGYSNYCSVHVNYHGGIPYFCVDLLDISRLF